MSIETLSNDILEKMPNINKWQRDFLVHLFSTFMIVRGRYNFENLSRYGGLNECIYRSWYSKSFNFMEFNLTLLDGLEKEERIVVFDPSYLPKSGKKTAGLGYFWSGCAGSVKRGIEIGGFASVGLYTQTALHLTALQTLKDKSVSFLDYYAQQFKSQAEELRKVSSIAVFDAYFSREPFVSAITELDFTVVSKLAKNAVLKYPYLGKRTGKPGRPQKYEGVVDKKQLDLNHFTLFEENNEKKAYEGKVYAIALKRLVKCVIVHTTTKTGKIKVETFFSTDQQMEGHKLWKAYKLRFQIEFLYRDGKQHMGLTHCQARSKEKIDFHVNASLTAVSLTKTVDQILQKNEKVKPFSLASIKIKSFNEFYLNRIFIEFGIPPETHINSKQYQLMQEWGIIAA